MKKAYSYILLAVATIVTLASCEKILEVDDPIDSITREMAYGTEAGVETLRNGLYTKHFFNNGLYMYGLDVYGSNFSDDLVATSTSYKTYYQNSYSPSTSILKTYWNNVYSALYVTNDFIEGAQEDASVKTDKTLQYLGEAYWFRAYDYFLLVNLYGGVPIITSAKPEAIEANSIAPRNSKEEVYTLIIDDLTKAQTLMANSTEGNDMITQEAATALLARVYLYNGNWQEAVNEASKLIPASDGGSGAKFSLETIDNVFLNSSKEIIMQSNQAGYYGDYFIGYCYAAAVLLAWGNETKYFFLSQPLVDALEADTCDLRNNWKHKYEKQKDYDVYYAYKYKNGETPKTTAAYECQVMLRLAEQYLIRAEANAHLGNLQAAVRDINVIRNRAGQSDFSSSSQTEILSEIELQRQKELFCECGHRWFDLNRTNRADYYYNKCGYKEWASYKNLLPIPQDELLANPNLEQNPGW